jgi:8-oxo-dGTP pyrophosphatase MutT (NUDIX family)
MKISKSNFVFCNNCGKSGHLFHNCKNPITSLGIIMFRDSSKGLEYLMIQRNDSFGFVEFIRGKYPLYNEEYLQTVINEMTNDEKMKIKNSSFEDMWKLLWGDYSGIQYKGEEISSKEKYEQLKKGIRIKDREFSLDSLIKNSTTNWNDPEWGFPKGRRNYQEKDIECAVREFEEETGYSKDDFRMIENIIPYEEIFMGSNMKSYKHKYYIGYMNNDSKNNKQYQKSEVRNMEWCNFEECIQKIRPYNLEKINILNRINNVLQEYRLY